MSRSRNLLVAALGLLAFVWPAVGRGQSTYTQPYNGGGTSEQIVSGLVLTNTSLAFTSAAFSTVGIDNIQINITSSNLMPSRCTYYPEVTMQGSDSYAGTFQTANGDDHDDFYFAVSTNASAIQFYLVGALPAYFRIQIAGTQNLSGIGTCGFSVTLTPISFDRKVQVQGTFPNGVSIPVTGNPSPVLVGGVQGITGNGGTGTTPTVLNMTSSGSAYTAPGSSNYTMTVAEPSPVTVTTATSETSGTCAASGSGACTGSTCSASSGSFQVNSAGWVINTYAGDTLVDTSGHAFVITANTATQLTVTCSGTQAIAGASGQGWSITSAGVTVYTSAGSRGSSISGGGTSGFDLQNVGATTLYCGTSSAVAATSFGVALAPDSVGGSTPKGDGGSWTETNLAQFVTIYCVAASSGGQLAVTQK